jgi:hypothetical protein
MIEPQKAAATPTEGNANAQTLVTGPGQQQQQTSQGQPANNSQAQTPSSNAAEAKSSAEPSYTFTSPEGVEFDAKVLSTFGEAAKELKLQPDAAQKLLNKVAPAMQARQSEQLEQMRNEWLEASKTDKEFGGERLTENLTVAKKALDAFGSPELRTLLNESGLGNHPEVIRFFLKAGKAISEDRYVGGTRTAGKGNQTGDFNQLAEALYGNKQQ